MFYNSSGAGHLTKERPAMPVPSEPSAASPAAASHRVFSALLVLPGVESEAEWEAHRTGFLRALAPQGFVEEELVLRAALLTWRLNRLSRFDTATAARDETAP